MNNVDVYKHPGHPVVIEQTRLQRDWMDETDDRHAYKCFPLSLVNRIGWTISFNEDIEFIWDGISDSTPDHVKILKGQEICSTNRGNGTVSFYTGLHFKTDENMSIMCIVPPNLFLEGIAPFSSIISTSFFNDAYPLAWKIQKPNHHFVIPAGTPIGTLIPISISEICNVELNIYDKVWPSEHANFMNERSIAWQEITKKGGFTNFYRDAVDHLGNKIGKHEAKSINMKINDFTGKKE